MGLGIKRRVRHSYQRLRYGFIPPNYDGMMLPAQCRFLNDTVMGYTGEKKLIVEIGSFRGCSTTWLAVAGIRNGFQGLIAIDLFTGTPSWGQKFDTYSDFVARMRLNRLDDFVRPIRGNSREVIKTWNAQDQVSILHIDGDHSYSAAKADAENYIPLVIKGGIVVFDDYDPNHPDVKRVVHELLGGDNQFEIIGVVPGGSIALRKLF